MPRFTIPPPPAGIAADLFRWFTDVRNALAVGGIQAPAYSNGWVAFAGPPALDAGYRKQNGRVYLHGFMKNGALGATAFTLPEGFRPHGIAVWTVMTSSNVVTRLDIAADGAVTPFALAGAGNAWLSLDGISFQVGE